MKGIIFIFVSFCLLNLSLASDILSALWEGDDVETEETLLVMKSLNGKPLSVEDSKLMIRRLSNLPFTDQVKTRAWYKLLRNRNIRNMDVLDWKFYEPLIPYLPISLLREVNFSDQKILEYFGHREFKQDQLSHLAEEVTQTLGDVLNSESKILMLGNIFCGFSDVELSKIKESTLRYLLEKNFFRVISACSQNQMAVVINLLIKYKILGPPRTWEPSTVRQVGSLIAGLTAQDLRKIQEQSFSEITPEIIKLIPAENLKQLSNIQVKNFDKPTLLSWRRKTRDLRHINGSSNYSISTSFMAVVTVFLLESYKLAVVFPQEKWYCELWPGKKRERGGEFKGWKNTQGHGKGLNYSMAEMKKNFNFISPISTLRFKTESGVRLH